MFNPVSWLTQHPELLPFVIFCLRICDVSLDTMRMICVVRGLRLVAASHFAGNAEGGRDDRS